MATFTLPGATPSTSQFTLPSASSTSAPATPTAPTDGFAGHGETQGGLPRSVNIPTNIYQANLMSNTSWADDCFIMQKFSNRLQAYMIGYVNAIYSDYAVYL